MPVYPIINVETKEQKEVTMSITEWENFKKENEEWIRDWSDPSTAPNSCELGEWKDTLVKKHPGWKELNNRFSNIPGSKVEKL